MAQATADGSRLGFFAALYQRVTAAIREGIRAGLFEDGPRMERLDVTFANRYLAALERFGRGEAPGECWGVAFRAASRWRPIIVQHLLLGMNAHINFDLGIAAAQTCPGTALAGLRGDFEKINDILAAQVPRVMGEMGQLSPWIGWLDRIDPKAEVALINFSIDKARAYAWKLAARLAALGQDEWGPELAGVDAEMALLGALIEKPVGVVFRLGLGLIRARECGDVRRVMGVLGG